MLDFITSLLSNLDSLTFNHWNIIGPVLDAIIPNAASGYTPGA